MTIDFQRVLAHAPAHAPGGLDPLLGAWWPAHDLVGAQHTAAGLAVGQVPRATGPAAFAWQALQHTDLGAIGVDDHHAQVHTHVSHIGIGADDHHAQVHAITGANHTVVSAALDLVGLSAINTLGLLTPSSNPGAAAAILRTDAAGLLQLVGIGIGVAPVAGAVSVGANTALSGSIRLPNASWVVARNALNLADVNMWQVDANNRILSGASPVHLPDRLYVGGVYVDPGANNLHVQGTLIKLGDYSDVGAGLELRGGANVNSRWTVQREPAVGGNRFAVWYYGGAWTTPFTIYPSGGTHVGLTPADPGGNCLGVQSKIWVNETANAGMTTGITINQGAADDDIVTLKSSDVGHGFTGIAEADTYGRFFKSQGIAGGLVIQGLKDGDGSQGYALILDGFLDEAADTTKTTAGIGVVVINSAVRAGIASDPVGANGNLVVMQNNGTTRFIFDAEGSAHADVEWIAFQDHDDAFLLASLERFGATGGWKDRTAIEQAGLAKCHDIGTGMMVNTTRLAMLLTGANTQGNAKVDRLGEVLGARQPHIEKPSGGIVADGRAREAISRILTALETHGILSAV